MSDVAYPSLTLAQQIFKDLVWNPAVKLGETSLAAYFPWLNLPIVREVYVFLFEKAADFLYSTMVLLVDVTAIKLVNSEHQREYDKASLQLKIIAHDKGLTSPEFQKARTDAKEALSRFTRFGAAGA